MNEPTQRNAPTNSPEETIRRDRSPAGEPPSDEGLGPVPDAGPNRQSGPEETEIWTGRTSWKHFAPRLTLWLAVNVAVGFLISWGTSRSDALTAAHAFWAVFAVVLLSGIPVVGRVALRVLGYRYRLTSQRLFIVKGIFSQTIDQSELVRVDDVRIRKTLIDRLLGLGTVAIVSTDATDKEITIEGITTSDQVAEAIRTQMRSMRRKSLYVENL